MAFLRRLFGGAKAPLEDSERPEVQPEPADVTPGPRRRYLEYVGGSSAKFYAIVLDQDGAGDWRVRFNFGRIGARRAWDARIEGVKFEKARRTYDGVCGERIRPPPAQPR